MRAWTTPICLLAVFSLSTLASCNREAQPGAEFGWTPSQGVAEFDPTAELKAVEGQTVYVPVYSQILVGDRKHPFALAVTLSVRNTDRAEPIVVTSVRYYDQAGELAQDFLKKPLRISPMAATEFFVQERDTRGGTSASFLVEWAAGQAVSEPVVEAVMVGTAANQGISFTAHGKVVARKTK